VDEWISRRYSDPVSAGAAWNLPAPQYRNSTASRDIEFTGARMYVGRNSLKVYDYYLFAQDVFANWVRSMRDVIRGTGSQQLVTVGQDEGGIQDRLSPAYWSEFVDFTTSHSWWRTTTCCGTPFWPATWKANADPGKLVCSAS